MHSTPKSSGRLALAAAVLALGVGAASAQPAAPQPAPEPVQVAADAPPGGSRDVAVGAGIGVLAGLVILTIIVGSGG